MLYTIGHKEKYEQYFKEQDQPQKLGKTEDYSGGSVWATYKEALDNCPKDYSIYLVDTDESNMENNCLIKTSNLLRFEVISNKMLVFLSKQKCRKLFESGETVYAEVFTFYMYDNGRINGTCSEGTCDLDYNNFDEWWNHYYLDAEDWELSWNPLI